MDKVKVEGFSDLVRDKKTGAVININSTESDLARQRKYNWRAQLQEQEQLKSDVDQLKNDMSDIKDLLTKLVEK
jgi:hypothetical protein